jgi:hypothetical protein
MAAEARPPGAGGVRNLRAMFENKDECMTSPPDRGRSPSGSIGMLSKDLSKTFRGHALNFRGRLTMAMQAEGAMALHHVRYRKCAQVLSPSKEVDSLGLSLA